MTVLNDISEKDPGADIIITLDKEHQTMKANFASE